MLVGWQGGNTSKIISHRKTPKPVSFTCFSYLLPGISLITFSIVQRWRPRHCVSPINPTLQAYIVQNQCGSILTSTEIITTFLNFFLLTATSLLGMALTPFSFIFGIWALFLLCSFSGKHKLLCSQWGCRLTSFHAISLNNSKLFQISSWKIYCKFFQSTTAEKLHISASASSAEKKKYLKFYHDKEPITICVLHLISWKS